MNNLLIINKVAETTKRNTPSPASTPTWSLDAYVDSTAKYDGNYFRVRYRGHWYKARTTQKLAAKIKSCTSI